MWKLPLVIRHLLKTCHFIENRSPSTMHTSQDCLKCAMVTNHPENLCGLKPQSIISLSHSMPIPGWRKLCSVSYQLDGSWANEAAIGPAVRRGKDRNSHAGWLLSGSTMTHTILSFASLSTVSLMKAKVNFRRYRVNPHLCPGKEEHWGHRKQHWCLHTVFWVNRGFISKLRKTIQLTWDSSIWRQSPLSYASFKIIFFLQNEWLHQIIFYLKK